MARGDKTKKPAFQMWLAGHPLSTIQRTVRKGTTTQLSSIKGWVLDWERGKQQTWRRRLNNGRGGPTMIAAIYARKSTEQSSVSDEEGGSHAQNHSA